MAVSVVEATLSPAEMLLRVAQSHPEFVSGELVEGKLGPEALIELRVEMPIDMKDDGVSKSGVRVVEPVWFRPTAHFPWQAPRVSFRDDFPRHFPHLLPTTKDQAPRPCLVEGDPDEFFIQFGLVEYGMFHLVEQAAAWLRKAAVDNLNDPNHGWEPMLRVTLRDVVEFDAEAARAAVKGKEGWAVWKARMLRVGPAEVRLGSGASAYIWSTGERVPLGLGKKRELFRTGPLESDAIGTTVVGVIWPDKKPNGDLCVSSVYWPEDVSTLGDLQRRAEALGCARGLKTFLDSVERAVKPWKIVRPVPVGIVLCAHRPFHLVGGEATVELLPYVVEVRPDNGWATIRLEGDAEPVVPAQHIQTLTADLLRSVAGIGERPPLAMLGCGSVGSKLAMHAARSGQRVMTLSDHAIMRPHNLARHALGGRSSGQSKAEELAKEITALGEAPQTFTGDLLFGLEDSATRDRILPRNATAIVNSTASLTVREALIEAAVHRPRATQFEAGLFGRGRVAYLLGAGTGGNPNPADLMATMYASVDDAETRSLMFDPDEGLTQIQIGQGCASLTMRIDDARLSMMTAGISLELGRAFDVPSKNGTITIAKMGEGAPDVFWHCMEVDPFEVVPIEGSGGWTLRVASGVANRIRSEARAFRMVETGGVMVGLSSARLKTVTVVDLIEAPSDSTRSATKFVLGTQGLHATILARHHSSGGTLFDVGTWHSHLADQGPSGLDWATAAELAAERAPPSVLLITTPKRFHALATISGGK